MGSHHLHEIWQIEKWPCTEAHYYSKRNTEMLTTKYTVILHGKFGTAALTCVVLVKP